MKILLGNEYLEVIHAETNSVVFTSEDIDEDDDDEEENEVSVSSGAIPLLYKIKLYKNAQAQTVERTVRVRAFNMAISALTDISSVLMLINEHGQAVYSVAWELVHSIDSEPCPPIE